MTRAAILLRAAALVASLAAAIAGARAPQTHHHRFDDAERWAHVFDDPKRDAWQKPREVIEALALARDAVVADVGAGTGYFAARLANMQPAGRVYAIDVEPDMVASCPTSTSWCSRRAAGRPIRRPIDSALTRP